MADFRRYCSRRVPAIDRGGFLVRGASRNFPAVGTRPAKTAGAYS